MHYVWIYDSPKGLGVAADNTEICIASKPKMSIGRSIVVCDTLEMAAGYCTNQSRQREEENEKCLARTTNLIWEWI